MSYKTNKVALKSPKFLNLPSLTFLSSYIELGIEYPSLTLPTLVHIITKVGSLQVNQQNFRLRQFHNFFWFTFFFLFHKRFTYFCPLCFHDIFELGRIQWSCLEFTYGNFYTGKISDKMHRFFFVDAGKFSSVENTQTSPLQNTVVQQLTLDHRENWQQRTLADKFRTNSRHGKG